MRDFQGNLGKINLVDKKICCKFAVQIRKGHRKTGGAKESSTVQKGWNSEVTEWRISVAVSTPPSHGGDSGSSPGFATKNKESTVGWFLICITENKIAVCGESVQANGSGFITQKQLSVLV